jgi:hypothetical protein
MLLDGRRFAEVFGTVGLAPAGKAVKFWHRGDSADFIVLAIAAQHTEMGVILAAATAYRLIFHRHLFLCNFTVIQ